ncbi:MAG: hypothetical protein JW913_16800 [Chitinispirillaceae bacterium]|nr:hypothetical protein [Chitinispirillaceae bacterium]
MSKKRLKTMCDIKRLLSRTVVGYMEGRYSSEQVAILTRACSALAIIVRDESFERRIDAVEKEVLTHADAD